MERKRRGTGGLTKDSSGDDETGLDAKSPSRLKDSNGSQFTSHLLINAKLEKIQSKTLAESQLTGKTLAS